MRLAFLSALVLTASVAFGHAALTYPVPRSSDSAIKTGPCGPYAKTNTPTLLTAGQKITVTWTETVNHPGYYRIAYSTTDTTADFNSHVIKNNIPNPDGGQLNDGVQITLPNINCDNCTLQLIQVMTNTNPPSNYYSCADIALSGSDAGVPDAGVPDAGSVVDAGNGGGAGGGAGGGSGGGGGSTIEDDAGTTGTGGGAGGGDPSSGAGGGGEVSLNNGTAQAEGGCAVGGFAPAILAPFLLAFALRRRR